MSPRAADPNVRSALVETAARLLTEEGPAALTTRRLAREVGASTMAVYTHFGGKDDLLGAISVEGFRRLARALSRLSDTDDPVEDLAAMGRSYQHNARANPALYRVMFGTHPAVAHLTPEDAAMTLGTFETLVAGAERCITAGRFRRADPWDVAAQLWAAAHGVVMLELAGFFDDPEVATRHLDGLMHTLAVGLGDDPERVERSVSGAQAAARASGSR